tara:strand:- start:406 stop:594 length:189 start_codon:yes stop_codon:yes gene_type:complete
MIVFTALLIPILFLESHKDFFHQAAKERKQGYTWHYVGQKDIDPNAKSIKIDDKYIVWKLKK